MTETKPTSFRLSEETLNDLDRLVELDRRRDVAHSVVQRDRPEVREIRRRRHLLEDAVYFLLQRYEDDMGVPDDERHTGRGEAGLDD